MILPTTVARALPLFVAVSVASAAQQQGAPPAKGISLLDRNLSLQMLANVKSDLKDN